MESLVGRCVRALERKGWTVKPSGSPRKIPRSVVERYRWLPGDALEFAETLEQAVSPDETAWLLTSADFAGTSSAAFAWNEWERQSLDAAGSDEDWRREISHFWDEHFPIMMSVKAGYAYFAIQMQALSVVVGEAPEFEEVSRVAASLAEFVDVLESNGRSLDRWI